MAEPNQGNRPLSPFMFGQYYRPQLTSMTSIFTRITGNALIVAGLMTVWWFVALATGPEAYARANGFITSWFGDLVMFLSVGALWYHTLAGIRHLIWDQGYMLDVKSSETYGQAMIIASVLLTIFTAVAV
ncbi:succinate dehydrogenase, cytochrome b556 subunit [Pelagovum pacificum]|uniref:Succinate dehydrogenase cytochrome b556 subunit n=1 Tax=Pelagovum pacificum TaxID=2588711 RepID=A0A5C5GC10_9RHOB|nr:succinate dehydrogenase, cytochrome b556 subunit [Pelagovum pacificum]QQA42441.1 succinate dehydrogenase, cytochrome b556 subunit [Pelagovum pacificum]TNY31524.1 succinate dehydrogenase, cytochrome b556 subunit [Pelagovum pacificum]